MVVVTQPEIVKRCCSKCKEMKTPDRIVKDRNICKDCCNKKRRLTSNDKVAVTATEQRTCSKCNIVKTADLFRNDNCNICKICNNNMRRKHYQENEEYRLNRREAGVEYKKKKKAIRDEKKLVELKKLEEEIGEDNTICKYCKDVKPKTHFRHNRLKCKDCENDDPFEKFKRYARTRIYNCLKRNKNKHAHEYLGCMPSEYLQWICFNAKDFTLENYGKVWHIDHVIPLSKFNFENEQEALLAFNWRNTTPLLARDNLVKNNKIIPSQIEQHLETLTDYHKKNSIELPQVYIDLYARFLEAGTPLEP